MPHALPYTAILGRLDGVRDNADDLVQTLVDYARKGQRDDFYDLARMSGVQDPDALWKGARARLHLPEIDTSPVDRNIDLSHIDLNAIIAEVRGLSIDTARAMLDDPARRSDMLTPPIQEMADTLAHLAAVASLSLCQHIIGNFRTVLCGLIREQIILTDIRQVSCYGDRLVFNVQGREAPIELTLDPENGAS